MVISNIIKQLFTGLVDSKIYRTFNHDLHP